MRRHLVYDAFQKFCENIRIYQINTLLPDFK